MILKSVRLRLTLWNVAILALFLVGFGLAMTYSVREQQARAIDQELANRAASSERFLLRAIQRREERERSGTPEPSGDRPTPPAQERQEDRRPEARTPPDDRSANPAVDRFERYARPRAVDTKGKKLGRRGDDGVWDNRAFALSVAGTHRYSNVQDRTDDGVEELRVYSIPLRRNNKIIGVIQVAHPLSEQTRLYDSQVTTLLFITPLALFCAGLAGIFLTGRALKPVREVTHAAAQIGAEDLSRRLEVGGQDEMGELAQTFNGMIGRLEDAFRNLEGAYQKLESSYEQQRRFTADASHELRTPLTRIKASTSLALRSERSAEEYRKTLRVVDQAADVMGLLIQDLLLLARSDSGQLELKFRAVPIGEILERAVGMVPPAPGVQVEIAVPAASMVVRADPDQLTRLFVNLLENALRHTPAGGQVVLAAWLEDELEGGGVVAQVRDTGEGIAPEDLPLVTQRFYRADPSRSRGSRNGGTGLGLAICYTIAMAHGRPLRIESELGKGTTVTVHLEAQPPALS